MKDQNNIKAFHTLFGLFMCSVALVAFLCNIKIYKRTYYVNDIDVMSIIINEVTDVTLINYKNGEQLWIDNDKESIVVDSLSKKIKIRNKTYKF